MSNINILKGKVGLAALQHTTTGIFCGKAVRAGAGFVTPGVFCVDEKMEKIVGEFHPPEDESLQNFMNRFIRDSKHGDVPVLVNVLASNTDSLEKSVLYAEEAGADIFEFNAHCPGEELEKIGAGMGLVYKLEKLAESIKVAKSASRMPFIVKVWAKVVDDLELIRVVEEAGADGIHFNLLNCKTETERLEYIAFLKENCNMLLMGSGGIKDAKFAKQCFTAGLDTVAIGTAALKKPELPGEINLGH